MEVLKPNILGTIRERYRRHYEILTADLSLPSLTNLCYGK